MHETILTDNNFNTEVINSDLPVIVDFWADWCSPCRRLAPIIRELAEEYSGRVKVCKLNVDEYPETANRFGVASLPTVLLFENGEVVGTSIGLRPISHYRELLNERYK